MREIVTFDENDRVITKTVADESSTPVKKKLKWSMLGIVLLCFFIGLGSGIVAIEYIGSVEERHLTEGWRTISIWNEENTADVVKNYKIGWDKTYPDIKEHIEYKNLMPNETYTISVSTIVDGKEVQTFTSEFVPDSSDGVAVLDMNID